MGPIFLFGVVCKGRPQREEGVKDLAYVRKLLLILLLQYVLRTLSLGDEEISGISCCSVLVMDHDMLGNFFCWFIGSGRPANNWSARPKKMLSQWSKKFTCKYDSHVYEIQNVRLFLLMIMMKSFAENPQFRLTKLKSTFNSIWVVLLCNFSGSQMKR